MLENTTLSFLLAILILFALIIIGLNNILGIVNDKGLLDQFCESLTEIINLGNGENFSHRLVNFLYLDLSVVISRTIIAFLAAKVSNFINYPLN